MDEFEIKTGQGYVIRFHSKEKRNDLNYYSVTLETHSAQTTIQVYDPPFGNSICDFFKRLDLNWRGLKGKLNWHSLEGEFRLSASSDSTGHTYLTTIACSNPSCEPPFSELSVTYVIESGQLAKINNDAQLFFK